MLLIFLFYSVYEVFRLHAWLCIMRRPGACRGLEEGMGASGSEVVFGCAPLYRYWEWNPMSSVRIASVLNQ